jgi:hypothetical protein
MTDIFDALKAEFPRDAVAWRAQSLNKEGTAAMALAYIDARDVMNRLDEVCGPGGWQCRYPHATTKTVCEIGIRVGDEWIWKADGAGDSDIEAEKGALSDAFKRSAVRWGIGRYLYDLDSPWVDCEHYVNHQGKKVWKKWIGDPWAKIKKPPSAPVSGRTVPVSSGLRTSSETGTTLSVTERMIAALDGMTEAAAIFAWSNNPKVQEAYDGLSDAAKLSVDAAKRRRLEIIESPFQEAAE